MHITILHENTFQTDDGRKKGGYNIHWGIHTGGYRIHLVNTVSRTLFSTSEYGSGIQYSLVNNVWGISIVLIIEVDVALLQP